jgi:hypothetical protein
LTGFQIRMRPIQPTGCIRGVHILFSLREGLDIERILSCYRV